VESASGLRQRTSEGLRVSKPELREEAERWLKENLRGILQMRIEEEI
jgi:hypothetical protein